MSLVCNELYKANNSGSTLHSRSHLKFTVQSERERKAHKLKTQPAVALQWWMLDQHYSYHYTYTRTHAYTHTHIKPITPLPRVLTFTHKHLWIITKKSDKEPVLSLAFRFHHNVHLSADHHHYPLNHKHESAQHNATCSEHYNRLLTQTTLCCLSIGSVQKLKTFVSLFVVCHKYQDHITSSSLYGNILTNAAPSVVTVEMTVTCVKQNFYMLGSECLGQYPSLKKKTKRKLWLKKSSV